MYRHRLFRPITAVVAAAALALAGAPPASAATTTVATDSFSRTVTNGLGTADAGGGWTVAGTASRFSVSAGAGRLSTLAGVQLSGYLNTVSSSDVDAVGTFTLPALPVGGSEYHGLVVRHTSATDYSGRAIITATGAVSVNLLAGGTSLKSVAVSGLTAPAGTALRIRTQAIGSNPTTLRARIWILGTPEPTAWQASVTDATNGLQGPGSVGIRSYLSSSATNGPITSMVNDLAVTSTTPNTPPTASFSTMPNGLRVAVDATASSDPDGTIASYGWSFGDGGTASGVTATHTYAASGTYALTLTVTDDQGATGTVSHAVTVTAANAPPIAAFTSSTTGLTAAFDGTGSSDPDGTISAYSWDFGDQTAAASGATPSHSYANPGSYTVQLTVTDDGGLTATTTHTVTVAATSDQPPTAAFSPTSTALHVAVDGSASSDPDGTIAAYAWTFGDGGTSSGATATHDYTAGGTYTITLTVTDDAGATGQANQQVIVSAPAPTTLASDAFGRTVASGLGTADTGGTWTLAGTASRFSVSANAAHLSTPAGAQLSGYLPTAMAVDGDATVGITLPALPAGGSTYAGLVLRHTANTDYTARVIVSAAGTVQVNVMAGTTSLRSTSIAGLTDTPGATLRLRAQVSGTNPTTIKARAWITGTAEPSTWAVTISDLTAALQGPGSVGIRTYLSGGVTNGPSAIAFDHLTDSALGGSGDLPPAASITASISNLTVSVDGGASTDPDGTITAYSWSFGDGSAATTSTATHTYATGGTYAVTLTVTDNGGMTGSASQSVTTGRPTQSQWLADVTTAMTGGTAYLDGQAGHISNGAIVLDIDNTALQSYYQPFAATPQVLAFEQRAIADGFTVLVATGRTADTGGSMTQLTSAGYQVASLCFRDPNAVNVQISKVACRANWVSQGYTIVANVGNHTTDLDGGNSGQEYLLPNYGFLD